MDEPMIRIIPIIRITYFMCLFIFGFSDTGHFSCYFIPNNIHLSLKHDSNVKLTPKSGKCRAVTLL